MEIRPRVSFNSDIELRKFLKKRLLIAAPLCFCLILLLDWLGITDGGFPATWAEALIQVGANILQTLFLMTIAYFGVRYVFRRFALKNNTHNPIGGNQPD